MEMIILLVVVTTLKGLLIQLYRGLLVDLFSTPILRDIG